jgi:hypothetical protein
MFHSGRATHMSGNWLSASHLGGPIAPSLISKQTMWWQSDTRGGYLRYFMCVSQHPHLQRLAQSVHLIVRNFVEVRWRSLFRSTSLGKQCTSYNAPPASRRRAADRWSLRNFLPRSSLFMVGKAKKSHGSRSELNSVCRLGKSGSVELH